MLKILKKIINEQIAYLKMEEINWVDVPLYDELAPANVIEQMGLRKKDKKDKFDKEKIEENKELWKKLLDFCPELQTKQNPKDRAFFFNILNTIKPYCVDQMVKNAVLNRDEKSDIKAEITCAPEFRDIFTN